MRINKKITLLCGVIFTALIIFHHHRLRSTLNYEYIAKDDILSHLHEEVSANFSSNALVNCNYQDIIEDDTMLSISLVDGDLIEGHKIREGGEYAPQECKPKFSTAIIVPYRWVLQDRAEALRSFLVYMHTFFRRQKIHYRIYVIEQVDSKLFNRAKLMNIGAVAAMKAGFPCLILHDVDLLPLRPANIYACTGQPRHMSASINKFRFLLPYIDIFGGVTSIISKQFKTVNGMSNEFFGWGSEDDDFLSRIQAYNLKVYRFEPAISRYYMLHHENSISKGKEWAPITKSDILADGLSTLKYTEVATVLHPLFTHIMVDL